jgi:hypothetical protein
MKRNTLLTLAVVVIVLGAVAAVVPSRRTEQPPQPAGALNIETARPGDRFGVWTVRENTIRSKEVTDFDGQVHTGPDGQISFTGSLSVTGRYEANNLQGGVFFFPDETYLDSFPAIGEGNELAIALPNDFTEKTLNDKGRATVLIDDLVYQQVFCLACDAWQGFIADVEIVIEDHPAQDATQFPKLQYISAAEWPPTVERTIAQFLCAEPLRQINGRDYCVGVETEAAAGTTYKTYVYNTIQGEQMVSVRFALRFPQCANYDEPKRSACQREQNGFDVDAFADQIAQGANK